MNILQDSSENFLHSTIYHIIFMIITFTTKMNNKSLKFTALFTQRRKKIQIFCFLLHFYRWNFRLPIFDCAIFYTGIFYDDKNLIFRMYWGIFCFVCSLFFRIKRFRKTLKLNICLLDFQCVSFFIS